MPEQSSPEEIERRRARALDVVRRLRSGTDFAQVAASFSDGPEALQGGGLGWRDQDRLPELFVDALVKMKPGEISEPLRSPAGFHVLQLLEKRGIILHHDIHAQTVEAIKLLARYANSLKKTPSQIRWVQLRDIVKELNGE